MSVVASCLVWGFCLSLPSGPAAAEPASESGIAAPEIVARADRVRFPEGGFQVDVRVTTESRGKDDVDVREYRVLAKGHDNSLVMTTAPPIDRGQILLTRKWDLWAYLPNVSQPVRLPLSQRLAGQVANGDLARANFSGDYDARVLRTELLDGEPHHVLELVATDRRVTYHKVIYWVREADAHPRKAEFYTLSGRLLKVCHYQNFREMGGAIRPTRLVLEDTLRSGERSVMEYSDMQSRDLPDKVFSKEYLKKLQ